MLGTRLIFGFLMAGVTLAVLAADEWMAPYYPLWLLATLTVTGLAAREIAGLFGATSARPSPAIVVAGILTLTLSNWAPHLATHAHHWGPLDSPTVSNPMEPVEALAWPLLTYVGIVMATFVAESLRYERPGGTTATIAGTVLAVAYVGLLGSFLVQMRWLEGPYHGLVPLAQVIVAAKGADTGAYTLGRIAGRRKLWPRLSPNKTVEGALGGLLFSVAGSLAVTAAAALVLNAPTLGWGASAAFGLVVGAAAQVGDLMESMLKRDCARKDASDTVPGFGGVLDVVDSLLFAGPVGFCFWLRFGP